MESKEVTSSIHGDAVPVSHSRQLRRAGQVMLLFIGAAAWWFIYRSLQPFAKWVTYSVLSIPAGRHLSFAVEFFVYEAPKVLKIPLIATFAGVVALGILVVGYVFNIVM